MIITLRPRNTLRAVESRVFRGVSDLDAHRHAALVRGMIMRSVRVDRASTPRQVVDRVAPVQYIEESVLDAMPRGTRKDVAVYFFKPCLDLDDTDLAKQYLIRNLYPCDPFALAAVNEADPSFAMRYPNATHWKDDRGAWCVAAFSKSAGGIGVCVDRGCGWVPGWYFAGCMTPP